MQYRTSSASVATPARRAPRCCQVSQRPPLPATARFSLPDFLSLWGSRQFLFSGLAYPRALSMLVVVVTVIVVVAAVDAMGERRAALGVMRAAVVLAVLGLVVAASSSSSGAEVLSSPADEVEALVAIREALRDPDNVLDTWAVTSGDDPCLWLWVACSGGRIYGLELGNRNLSGRLSPAIGKLRSLRNLFLDHNSISGPIPETIGGLPLLQRVDLSYNRFNGTIPRTLGGLKDLYDVKLSHNDLSGSIPDSLITSDGIFILDLSFNNLSGTVTEIRIKNVLLEGNPLLRYPRCGERCDPTRAQEEITVPVEDPRIHSQSSATSTKTVLLCMSTALVVAVFVAGVVVATRQWRRRRQIFADIDDKTNDSEVCLGHLKRYMLKDIKHATNNFNPNNILGQGGFGIVYKAILHDGTIAAVKRLKEFSTAGEAQFHTEVEVISLVVHRNLLSLIGFCSEDNERLLVYPYMLNGTVSSKLQAYVSGRPALDWSRRKKIALGAARGLAYLHEHCDPKIIHRDIKAANILLDDFLEAIVADFGLAKLLGQGETHVFSAIRGTFGRIAPEYIKKGESSEKTDVFAYGLLLVELITGRKTLDVHDNDYEKGGVIDLARELLEEDQLSSFVDKRLRNNYNHAELKEMVQMILLCTMYSPTHRPRMSEIIRMLEGDGSVARRWEALKNVPITPIRMPGTSSFSASLADYYSREDERNSVELEAIELSGPR